MQRGHTVDRLTEAELQEVALGIEKLQQQRAQQHPTPAATHDAGAGAAASSKAEVAAEANNKEEEKLEKKAESKAERKKRLHARNMRYYRSFLSSSPQCIKYYTVQVYVCVSYVYMYYMWMMITYVSHNLRPDLPKRNREAFRACQE